MRPLQATLFEPERKISPRVKYQKYTLLDGSEEYKFKQINDGSIITRFDKTPHALNPKDVICPHFVELKWAYGCPYDCSWCYLKGTFRFRPEGIKPVSKDFEKIKLHLQTFFSEVQEPEILNSGEIADSLMFENGVKSFSKFVIPLFEEQDIHKILFLTKSTNITNLLEIEEHRQTIVSFSLNAVPVAAKWERRAPDVIRRVSAAGKLYNAGYSIRIRIDPMVPIDNWYRPYKGLIDLIFSRINPERITLGSLRGLQSTINQTKDSSWTIYLKESSNWGKKIDFDKRFLMYSKIMGYLDAKYKYNAIALCKETAEMWEKLRMNYQKIKCNCVQ